MYLAIDSLDINNLVMRKQNDWNPFLVVLISFIKDHREEELQERPIREERDRKEDCESKNIRVGH